MNWKNRLTKILNIQYPIVQAPMLGVTSVEMVATISNLDGLGSLPVGGLSPEKTSELIRQTKALTGKPFAVNLFANETPELDYEALKDMTEFLKKFCLKHHLEVSIPSRETFHFYSYEQQLEVLLQEDIPIVSFTFGILGKEIIKALKDKGVILIGTATCLKEAQLLAGIGIDIITAQGIEAGGHRGSFLKDEPIPQIGLMSLIPQIATVLKIPVLAAGGICDGNTIKAAMALGASGVQIGSAFIASNESIGIPAYKKAIQNASDTDSVLTNAFTGRWARGLRNKFISEFENTSIKIPEYPIQAHLISGIRMAAMQRNDIEFTNLWCGQSSSRAEAKPAAEIFKKFISSVEELE